MRISLTAVEDFGFAHATCVVFETTLRRVKSSRRSILERLDIVFFFLRA